MTIGPAPAQDDYYTALRAFMLAVLPAGIEIVQAQDNRVSEPIGPDYVLMNEVSRRRLSTNVTTYADCAFVGTIAGAVLTVTAVRLGTILTGARLLGEGVAVGTAIGAQQSGTTGGPGVYALTVPQTSPISGVPLATGAALIAQPTEISIQVDIYGPNSADNASVVTTLMRDDYASMWLAREGWKARGVDIIDVGEARQMAFIDGEQQYEDRFTFDVKMQADQVTSPSQDFADSVTVTARTVDAVTGGVEATGGVTVGNGV